jgi:hypothetical protein
MALDRIFTVKLLKNWPFFIECFYSGTATHSFEGIEMRVKIIIVLALAVLLIVSSASAMASYFTTLDQSLLKSPSNGLFSPKVYNPQNANSLGLIDGVVKNSLDISKDMYDSRGSDLLSGDTTGVTPISGELNEIPGPLELISAMVPAGYGNASRIGDHNVKNSLLGTSLI